MPYLCDVKNKLNSITMKYKSRSIAKVIVPVFLVVSLFAFTTHTTEQPEGTPLFITGITPYKSGMIVSQKGVQKVSIYSSDYKERLQEWELDEVPTGVATDGDQIYARWQVNIRMVFISCLLPILRKKSLWKQHPVLVLRW